MKVKMYSITIARCIILLALFLLLPLFFALYVVLQVSELYLQCVWSFLASTRSQVQQFEQLNNSKK